MKISAMGPILLLLGLISCSGPSDEKSKSDLPIETKEWVNTGDGYLQYYTNDWNKHYNYQSVGFNSTDMNPWVKLEGSMRKKAGSPDGLFGLMICDDGSGNYFRVVLDGKGNYAILRIKNGVVDKTIAALSRGSHLVQGIGVETSFKIETVAGGDITISFNGQYEDRISAVDLGSTVGGRAGFWLELDSDYGNFPNAPSCVEFKVQTPVSIP